MAWPARRSGKFCGICLVQFGALCAATTDGYNHNNSAPVFHQVLVIRRSILPRRENACSRVKSWETRFADCGRQERISRTSVDGETSVPQSFLWPLADDNEKDSIGSA